MSGVHLARPTIARIEPYSPGKPIEEARRELGLTRFIKLASNESPIGPSPLALEAMRDALADVRLYPDNACYELRRALSEHLEQPPHRIFVGRGSDEIIHMTGLAFLNPGDEVIYATPPFALYPQTAQVMDAREVAVPLREFVHDLDAMAAAVTPQTKLVFIANPHNPSGTMVSDERLQKFLDAVPEHVVVAIDEAYHEYVERPDYPVSLRWVDEGRNVIVYRTFSKIYALAGLRVGYGVVPDHLHQAMGQVRPPFNVSSLGQVAALASLRDPDQVSRGIAANRAGKSYLTGELDRLGLGYVPSQANFVLVDLGRDCRKCFDALLRRGVIVRTGDIFGLPTMVRVTVGTREENRAFIDALTSVIEEVPPQ